MLLSDGEKDGRRTAANHKMRELAFELAVEVCAKYESDLDIRRPMH